MSSPSPNPKQRAAFAGFPFLDERQFAHLRNEVAQPCPCCEGAGFHFCLEIHPQFPELAPLAIDIPEQIEIKVVQCGRCFGGVTYQQILS